MLNFQIKMVLFNIEDGIWRKYFSQIYHRYNLWFFQIQDY